MVNIDQPPDFYGDKMTLWSVAGFEIFCAPACASDAQFASTAIRAFG